MQLDGPSLVLGGVVLMMDEEKDGATFPDLQDILNLDTANVWPSWSNE